MKKKEYDFAKIKEQMIKDKLLVYSPTDWNYDREKDTTFDFFVRMPSTALRNLFLDEELLTEYHKDIKVTDKNNGIFLVEISEELMQKLPAEDHELLLQLTGVKDTKETIHVK